jgi:hypothetical protein
MRISKCLKMLFTMSVVSLCIVSIASAGDQDRKRDRKKDKSCQSSIILDEKAGLDLAALKTRDRKKDGSCQSTISEEKAGFDLAALKKRDRKKDGTCKGKDTLPVSV